MNPVVGREFVGIIRSRRAVLMLLTLTALFSLAVLSRWPAAATVDLSGKQSIEVFRVFGYGLLAGVLFLVPAFPATSIVNERNGGTLTLLINSPLSALSIYLGKISGVLIFSVLVLLCSLPACAACYAMGGIDLKNDLAMLYLILFVMIVQYVALAMMVSSFVHSADAAVRITYSAVLGLFLLPLVPAVLSRGSFQSGFLADAINWMRCLSPLPAVMEIMNHQWVGSSGLKQSSTQSGFIWIALISSALFAGITLGRLNHRIFDRSKPKGIITDDRGLLTRIFRRLIYIVDPQRRKRGIPWYLNPVMVKEFRVRRFGRSQWLLRLIAVCAIVSVVLTFLASTSAAAWGVKSVGGILVLLQVILVVVLTPSLASGLISGERDGKTWQLLRLTPLSPHRIVSGKLLSVIWTLALVLLSTFPGYLLLIFIEPSVTYQVQQVSICLALTALYALAVSAGVGSLFRATAVSTTVSYVVVVLLFLIPVLFWLGRDAPFGYSTVYVALLSNPVGAALNIVEAPGFRQYDLLPYAWWVSAVVSFVMFLVLGIQVWRLTRAG